MRLTIAIPWHFMENWQFFLNRCLKSIEEQTFKDYEVVLIKHSTMPVTSNRVIEAANGDYIKMLYMDDYLANPDSLQTIANSLQTDTKWLVTGCLHDNGEEVYNYHTPKYTQDIHTGNNGIGSPSVLTLSREGALLFDTNLSFLLDCELYHRLYKEYGPPTIVDSPNVIIGIGKHQTSNLMPTEEKQKELGYVLNKYA